MILDDEQKIRVEQLLAVDGQHVLLSREEQLIQTLAKQLRAARESCAVAEPVLDFWLKNGKRDDGLDLRDTREAILKVRENSR